MYIKYEDCYEFIKEQGYGISSLTRPENHTIVFIMLKIQNKLSCLANYEDCFVFYQKGMIIPPELEKKHTFCETENASEAFAKYVEYIFGENEKINRLRKYSFTDGAYTVGENVDIGEGTYIEPGVFIDHDVVIGNNCTIKYGAVLRNCQIGDNCIIYENAMIGNEPYNLHVENGRNVHSIAVGKSVLCDYVDVGAHSIVDRGTLTNTILNENVKLDTYVHIGHDAIVGKGTLVTSSSIVGGFCEVGAESEICSATLMKRIKIGEGAFVGLNSGVISDVADGMQVFGYPARVMKKR